MRRLITNGRIVDPSQRIDAKLNLLVENNKIIKMTADLCDADEVIDASGLVVCPGFIDLHAHEDPVINGVRFADEEKANLACLLRMGVTTCLAGNCGDNFHDPVEYMNLIDRNGCFINVAMLAGYTWFRERCTHKDRYLQTTPSERAAIGKAICFALDSGCAGISFGLEYVPGIDAEELNEAVSHCTNGKKMVAAHIRSCAEESCSAVTEILEAGKSSDVRVQISHIGSMAGYGQMEEFLNLIDAYRAGGVDACCDCYPYTAFSTTIGSAPYDDLNAMHCKYEDIELCEGTYRGKRCTREIFEQERKMHPEYLTVGHVMKEEEIIRAYAHPNVAVGSDCFLSNGNGHPRAAGAFPRFLHQYASGSGLSLSEALYRITSLPAIRLGLKNRGTLRPGAVADLVLFDPVSICDRATFSEPTLPPEGIAMVIIGGKTAVKDGIIVDGLLGRSIRL